MNGKAKLIATSGLCGALSVAATLLAAIPALNWCMPIFAVLASITVTIPMLIDARNLVYSLLIYAVCATLGVFVGLANIIYVAPIITFCIPFAIVKVYGESFKVTEIKEQTETLEDPFQQGETKQVVAVAVSGKKRLPTVVKWILYYVLLEIGIGLTLLAAYFLTQPVFFIVVNSQFFYWALGLMQILPIPFDLLMRGCIIAATKILRKVVK